MNNPNNNNLTDQDLITAVLNGERRAFGLIIKKTEGLVAQITFKMISSPANRKDIAQDVLSEGFQEFIGFKFKSKLSTWIGQITYNACLNRCR